MGKDDKIAGSIYLSAFGDAWGYRTEFIHNHEELVKRYDTALTPPAPAIITDDTQMHIAVLKAIKSHNDFFISYDPDNTEHQRIARLHFLDEFLVWKEDPRNNRAPGMTCLGALGNFEKYRERNYDLRLSGLEGSVKNSKGCGANMRVPWIGLHRRLSNKQVASLAYEQAVVTHGHPFGTISAAFTALTTRKILSGQIPAGGIGDYLLDESNLQPIIGDHPAWKEFNAYLSEAFTKAKKYQSQIVDPSFDVCSVFGEGWIADEAFVLAVILCDAFLNDKKSVSSGINAVRRAAHLTGDSDSVACITGAFMGLYTGKENLPLEWDSWLEDDYHKDLQDINQFLLNV